MTKTITLTAEQAEYVRQVIGRHQVNLMSEAEDNDLHPDYEERVDASIAQAGEILALLT